MPSYIERIRGPQQQTSTVPINSTRREAAEGLHPYAAAIRRAWLDRLDNLASRPWTQGDAWDTNCFVTARKLIEPANSTWAGYGHADARADYFDHAPTDSKWDQREKCWTQAEKKAVSVMLPEPEDNGWTAPDVTVLDEMVKAAIEEGTDPLARFRLIDWPALKRDVDHGERWIAEPLIAAGRMTALYSAPKAGKSLLVLEIIAAIALGLPVLSRPAQDPVGVLYIDFENDPRGDIKPRLEDMGHDLDDLNGKVHYATFPALAMLDTPQGGYELLWLAEHLQARVVVIDTVSRTVGGEENDNNTWLAFYKHTGKLLKGADIACLRLDHSGKDRERGMRGGSAKYGDVDMVWRLTAITETVIELDCTDHRPAMTTTSLTLVRHTDPLRHDVSGDPFAVVMDAKEADLAATLDRLEIPSDWGRDRIRGVLADAGIKVENTLLGRVIKARKLQIQDLSRTGRGQVRTADPVTACPDPPVGGRTADRSEPVRTDRTGALDNEPTSERVVACKNCYTPVDRDVAYTNAGLCLKCAADASAPEQDMIHP